MTRLRVVVTLAFASGLSASCWGHRREPVVAPPPAIGEQQLAPVPSPAAAGTSPAAATDTANEVHVTISTNGREADVRPLLDYVARQGKFTLVYAPNLERKVRIDLEDVPVSVALEALLRAADLTLESTAANAARTSNTSVVFYQLPVNIDSLSVDAIMKRFGVGRSMAELIVRSRTNKP